jgi:hypothetical protein
MSDSLPDSIPSALPVLQTKYRDAPRMLAPYVDLPLTEPGIPLSFPSIILGPSMEAPLLEEVIKGYLSSVEVEVGNVKSSGIPLKIS